MIIIAIVQADMSGYEINCLYLYICHIDCEGMI